MIRIVLLVLGFILLLVQQYIIPIDLNTQFIVFLSGIVLLGIPHGAADLLIATKNADTRKRPFSKWKFLVVYLAKLSLFAGILWSLPIAGNLLFIFFAAYHFGETDLYHFNTDTFLGKLFIISYGLVILCVIILHHFDDVRPILQLFKTGEENSAFIDWLGLNRYSIMSVTGIIFFTTAFLYFVRNSNDNKNEKGQFLIRFAVILFILFQLPLLIGFTFYFVIWHSVLSLNNIVFYLKNNNGYSERIITKQILIYSALAIGGIGLFGLTGFMFISSHAMAGYVFLGLAVLTAPHMQVMYEMYNSIRISRPGEKQTGVV